MANLKKKTELVKFLKSLDASDFPEATLIDDIILELETIRTSISKQQDLSPYYQDVQSLESKYSILFNAVSELNKALLLATEELKQNTDTVDNKFITFSEDISKKLKKINEEFGIIETDIARLHQQGGGSAHRKLLNNGVEIATKYTDLNLIGSGVTISTANNDTKRTTDVTLTTSGGGFTTLAPTEMPDGSRTVFTFSAATSKPTFVVSDNAMTQATSKSGTVNWTWNSGTKQVTMTIPPQDDIVAIQ